MLAGDTVRTATELRLSLAGLDLLNHGLGMCMGGCVGCVASSTTRVSDQHTRNTLAKQSNVCDEWRAGA